jgi:uncharacterized protein
MSDHHGKFVWYELMTTDTEAAKAFYRDVTGWAPRAAGVPGVDYTLFSANGADVGGMMRLPDEACEAGAQPGWNGYIAVEDVDAFAERIAQAGGEVHVAPQDIPDVGRFAMVSDPQGAVFALFSAGDGGEPPDNSGDAPGKAGWRELHATDWEAAFDFYSRLFGWTKGDAVDMGDMGVYQLFAAGDETIGGMMTVPEMPRSCWNFYFNVEGIDAAKSRVEAGGGQVCYGPQEVPGGAWFIHCTDPQGAPFALVSARR